MKRNPFKELKRREWVLWIVSVIVVLFSNIATGNIEFVTLADTLTGVTALIFIAKGDVWGQILTVVFSFLYGITSLKFRYWGEIITYLGMTMPIAFMSVITWLRHPYKKNKNEVKIHKLKKTEIIIMLLLTAVVTVIFGFILKMCNTPNLFFSTVSITTSFLASYLMLYRNPYYALAYSANDIVLIILWVLASVEDIAYFPMVMCFTMFLINDIYGFISWRKREKKQRMNKSPAEMPELC